MRKAPISPHATRFVVALSLDSTASLFYGEACSIDPCAGRAYQWSRHPPSITHPRENVIIRLCSIECNFGAPLTVRLAFQRFVAYA